MDAAAVLRGVCESTKAIAVLARCAAARARGGSPTPMALEAGVGLLREYYEANPEVSVAETAARCARIAAAYPSNPEEVEIDWGAGSARCAAVFGLLISTVLGSLIETDGSRFDPHRASALYHRALHERGAAELVRQEAESVSNLLRLAGRARWSRWTARLARICLLALRLSEHSAFDRDRFVELFFEIVPPASLSRLFRRMDHVLGHAVATGPVR